MIAKALGGEVVVSRKGWGVGCKTAKIVNHKSWMSPKATEYTLVLSHSEQVLEIPTGAQLIASNEHCPNSMFQMDDHFLAIQAHPEFCPDYARAMMELRAEAIGKETVDAAVRTLDDSRDLDLIMQWILNFISSK